MRRTAIVLLLLVCPKAWGQIEGPALVKDSPPNPIEFSVQAPMPPEAEFNGGWRLEAIEGEGKGTIRQLATPNTIGIWAQGGTKYRLTYSGFWLHLGPEITVTDVNGEPHKFRPYLGHGMFDFSHEFVVGKVDPKPNPLPPAGEYAIIVEDVRNRPQWTGDLWQQLRQIYGLNKLLIVSKDSQAASLQKYLSQISSSDKLPVMFLLSAAGEIVSKVPVPGTVDGVKELIDGE